MTTSTLSSKERFYSIKDSTQITRGYGNSINTYKEEYDEDGEFHSARGSSKLNS